MNTLSRIFFLSIFILLNAYLNGQKTGYVARATEPPVIDGIRESIWDQANSYNIDYNYNGTFDGPDDLAAKWYGLWDTDNIYFLAEITDDVLKNSGSNAEKYWIHDCLEIFFDMLNEKNGVETGDNPTDDKYQYRFIYGLDEEPIVEQPPVEGVVNVSKATVYGYIIEIKMPWAALIGTQPIGPVIIGRSIGAEFQVADLDNNPEEWMPDANFLWNNPTGDGLKRAEKFGTLVLVDNNLPDTIAPAPVNDLTANALGAIEAELNWTSTGDDTLTGLATSYEIRYSTIPINEAGWLSATLVDEEIAPEISGTPQAIVVKGLTGNTLYYFALRTKDEAGNISAISNVSSAETAPPDTVSPDAITDLSIVLPRPVSMELSWTAPGDDGNEGSALYYEIRYNTEPLTEVNWKISTPANNVPEPALAGTIQSMIVIGLKPGTQYYFAIKTTDEQKNTAAISNIVTSSTTELTVYYKTPMDQFIGTNAFIDDPLEKIKVAGFIREYHPWSWDAGEAFPNNKNAWNPSRAAGGNAWFFDEYYLNLFNEGITVSPCIMNSASWLNEENNFPSEQKPVRAGLSTTDPNSYSEHADHMYQYAARYGSSIVADSLLKLSVNQPRVSGLGYIRYLENWNEPDRSWGPKENHFNAEDLAAMGSADRDGHEGTMGITFGVKNADPGMKLVMGGLSEADLNYVEKIRQWCLLNRKDKAFIYDVINVHRYTPGVCPEKGNIRETMQSIVDYRDQFLPDVEVWITEFGWDSGTNDTPFSCPAIGSYSREEVQAMWIAREYLLLASTGIDRAAQFMLRNVDNDGKTQFETCGLVNEKFDWSPKPSWYYTYSLKNTLKGMYYAGEQNSYNSNVLIYKFENSTRDTTVYAVWAPTAAETIVNDYHLNLTGNPSSVKQVELTTGSISGISKELTINRNTVTLSVSEKPLLIISSQNATVTAPENIESNPVSLLLYPNPARERLTIKALSDAGVGGSVFISIRNAYGQIVKQERIIQTEATCEWNTDISSLAGGVYLLEVSTREGTVVKRFIKI